MWDHLAITIDNHNLIIEATRQQGGASRQANNQTWLHPRIPEEKDYSPSLQPSHQWKGSNHPHLNPLPSRERKIKEKVFQREREIRVVIFLRRPRSRPDPQSSPPKYND
jgi:hypothetical protein